MADFLDIIADGGIVEDGDIAKAIACGCFCGDEKVITKNGRKQIQKIKKETNKKKHNFKKIKQIY